MDDRIKLTEVRGWGPDFTEVSVGCPVAFCTWERMWDDAVTLGEIGRTIEQHMEEKHSDHRPVR